MDDDSSPGGVFIKLASLARRGEFRLPDQVCGMVKMLVEKYERSKDPRGKLKRYSLPCALGQPRCHPSDRGQLSELQHIPRALRLSGSAPCHVCHFLLFKQIFVVVMTYDFMTHCRKVKAMRGEQLYLPGSCIENFQAAKRMVDMWKRAGPLALQTDCTKVCAFTERFRRSRLLRILTPCFS